MTSYSVNLYRFTDDPAAMVAFYEHLGLRTRVTSDGGGYALLEAAAGWVAVHPAATAATVEPGETQLVLLTEDADAAATDLASRGLDARVWDESYGRQAAVRTPLGSDVWINEHQVDLYGYRAHADGAPGPIEVSAIWYSEDFDRDSAWLGALGFEQVGYADDWWRGLTNGRGRVGLHGVDDQHPEPRGETLSVSVGFQTPEPLDALADRLRAAGYTDARIVTDAAATKVHVTDPDGREVEIHPIARG